MDEREFELINIIGQEIGANQRQISRMMDMSLGMVNMLIKRMLSKGYIRIEQLDKRKVQYLLTPKGFAEKMRKSVRYTLKTINSITLIKNNLMELFQNLYTDGVRQFYVYSEPDLSLIVTKAFYESSLEGASITKIDQLPTEKLDGVILIGKEDVDQAKLKDIRCVDLIEEISKEVLLAGV